MEKALKGWEVQSEHTLGEILSMVHLRHKSDELIWLGNNGQLYAKDLYHKLDQGAQVSGIWSHIWKLKLPAWVKLFVWKLLTKS